MSRNWQRALVSWAAERRGCRGLPEPSSAGGVLGGGASWGGRALSLLGGRAGGRAGVAHLGQVPVKGLSSSEPRNPELPA